MKKLSRGFNTIRKSKLFQRKEIQPLEIKDILKVIVIAGIITIPIVFGFII